MHDAIASRIGSVTADRSQGKKLTVVPILGPSHDNPPYELLREQTLGSILVTEVSQAGSVPELRVENKLDQRVFLMDGQELIGAKQNRILNTDVLVPAHTTVSIPVSCVEQGRWHAVSPQFHSGKSASHRTRSAKLSRVHDSLREARGHDADQGAVWDEVRASISAAKAASPTSALSDAYAKRQKDLEGFRENLKLPERAVGIAVFQGGKFQGLDLFDRHATLQYFWQSLVDSYALDLLEEPVDPSQPPKSDEAAAIRALLDQVAVTQWESFRSPGEGTDWRMQDTQYAASSLVWNEEVVLHLQVFPKAQADTGGRTGHYRPRIRRPYGDGDFVM